MKLFLPQRLKQTLSLLLLLNCFYGLLKAQNCSVNANVNVVFCPDAPIPLLGSGAGLYDPLSILWKQVGGPSVIINSPTSFTSSVTGYVGNNSYTYRLFLTCNDGSRVFQDVTYTAKPSTPANGGADITGCQGVYNLSGNTFAPGEIGVWSVVGSNNGVSIADPSNPSTSITLEPGNGGQTTLRWLITNTNGCFTFDDIIVTNCGGVEPVDAGADQDLNQNQGNCFSLTTMVTMNATPAGYCGIGEWTVVSGPNLPTIANPGANNTQISNLIEGTYVFRWSVAGPCANGEDLVTITIPPPTSGITVASVLSGDQTFCDVRTSAVLQGSIPIYSNETVTWVQTGGPLSAMIDNPNSPVTNITGLDGTSTYTFSYTIYNPVTGCSSTASVTLRFAMNATLDIISDNLFLNCGQTSVPINYSNAGPGAVQWRIISGPAMISTAFQDAGPSPFTVSNLLVAGTYMIELRKNTPVGASCLTAADQVRVVVSRDAVLANAGTDQMLPCNILMANLAGNTPFTGTGSWSQVSGPAMAVIADIYNPQSPVNFPVIGGYIFRWTITGGPFCDPAEDDVLIRVTNTVPTTADAGANQLVCSGTPVYLSANTPLMNEVGTWSVSPSAGVVFSDVHAPHATVTGLAANTAYTFTWTIQNACGTSADNVGITTNNTPGPDVANAGLDRCLPAGTISITLAGNNPAVGTGLWTKASGPTATIISPMVYNTNVNLSGNGVYVFVWANLNSGCSSTTDTVIITISNPVSIAAAGPDQQLCSSSAEMTANTPTIGTGTWTQLSGPGGAIITAPNGPNTTITGLVEGVYQFVWTIANGACSDKDTVKLLVSTPPTSAFAGNDQTICGTTSATLAANAVASGTWTVFSGPNTPIFSNTMSPTTTVSGLVFGVYVFQWNSQGGPFCPIETDQVQVTVYPTANAGADQSYCEEVMDVSLIGSVASTGTWTQTSGPSAIITTTSANSATASGLTPGIYVFQYAINQPGCNSSDQMTVTLSAPPTEAEAGMDQIACAATSFVLAGNTATIGTGTWSILDGPGGGTFTAANANSPNATFTPAASGVYLLSWKIVNGVCAYEDQVRIYNYGNPTPANAGPNQTAVCANQVTMAANNPTVGLGNWTVVSTPMGAPTPNIASPVLYNTVISNLVAGTYVFQWTISNGPCTPSSSQVTISVEQTPTPANAGPDQVFCSLVTSATLAATVVVAPTTGAWSIVSKPGSAPNPTFSPSATAPNATVNGLQEGIYVFQWTTTRGICTATDQVTITNVPTIANVSGTTTSLCYGDPMFLVGNTPPPGGTGVWTKISGGPVFILNPSNPTTQVLGYTAGTYTFRWTITNAPSCLDFEDVVITVNPISSQALAGADQILCAPNSTSINTLLTGSTPAGGETGTWSWVSGPNIVTFSNANANSPGATANGLFPGTPPNPSLYQLRWTIALGPCSSSDDMQIKVWENPTTAAAGADQQLCNQSSFSLAATPTTVGTGMWTKVSGPAGTISNSTSASTTVTGAVTGTFVFRWTTTNGPCISTDEVTINNYPAIAGGPGNATICDGGMVNFSAGASGGSGSYTYVWQVSTNGCGGPWTNVGTNASYSTGALLQANGPRYYQVIITDANGVCSPYTSLCATVNVIDDPVVSVFPLAATICAGETQTLTATASVGAPLTVTYQWQMSTTNCLDASFSNIPGATGSTYTTPALNATTHYRVVISANGSGCTIDPTACVTVTVNPRPNINLQPQTATICTDDQVSFTSAATAQSGGILSYQWQVSTNGGSSWSNLSNAIPYAGATTTTLTINPVAITMNTYQYRMVATETGPSTTCSTNSNPATLTVNDCYSLGNQVWFDVNGNGLFDGTEAGIDGVTVRLLDGAGNAVDDPNVPGFQPYVLTTSGGGYYRFDNILGGDYIVEVVPPLGYFSSTINAADPDLDVNDNDDNGTVAAGTNVRSQPVTLGPGNSEPTGETGPLGGQLDSRSNLTVDFGFIQPMNIGNYVWYDTNNDGMQGPSALEPPVVGATMTIFNGNGTPVTIGADGSAYTNTTLTDNNGNYVFNNLPPGDYYVRLTPTVIWYGVTPISGGDVDANPSDTDNNGEMISGAIRTQVFTLVNLTEPNTPGDGDGTNGNLSIDFGLVCIAPQTYAVTLKQCAIAPGMSMAEFNLAALNAAELVTTNTFAGPVPAGLTVTFHNSLEDAQSDQDPLPNLYTSPTGNIWARVEAPFGGEVCYSVEVIQLLVNQRPLAITTVTNVLCNGGSTGTALVTPTSGQPNFTYLWSANAGAATTPGLTNLAAGTYLVTITDANDCSSVNTITITQPTSLTASTGSIVNVNCRGNASGSATAIPAGGTAPYTYDWSNNGAQTIDTDPATMTGLAAGTYTVTITDANGCTATSTAVVTQPAVVLSATITSTNNPTCTNGSAGSVTVTVAGGTSAYSYNWNGASTPTGDGTPTITGLSAGAYLVSVTDARGCTAIAVADLDDPTGIDASIVNKSDVTCFGAANGTATVTVIPASASVTYDWNGTPTGDGTASISGLAPGNYTVTVTQTSTGCTAVAFVMIGQPGPLAAVVSGTNPRCNGAANGSASVSVQGGVLPYSYNWNGASTPTGEGTTTITGLLAGTHTVTVTDANGCQVIGSVMLVNPAVLTVSVPPASVINVACFGGATGSATAVPLGGTAPYTYDWSNDGAEAIDNDPATVTGLSAGTYNVTITDANGCIASIAVTITQPASALTATITNTTNATCSVSSGSATVLAAGGTSSPAYTYDWSNDGFENPDNDLATISNLAPGAYEVIVTDGAGCTATAVANVPNPAGLSASITAKTNPICLTGTNGSATVTAVGGTGPFDFDWSHTPASPDVINQATTAHTLSNLPAGNYTITVTDANQCVAIVFVTLVATDNVAPVIASCPTNITNLTCGQALPAPFTTIAAFEAAGGAVSDNCTLDANLKIKSSDFDNNLGLCNTDGVRSITRTYTIFDEFGNKSSCTQTLSYIDDTTPPVIGTPAANLACIEGCINGTIPPQIQNWLAINGGATATDACSSVTWTNNYNAVSAQALCGPGGTLTVIFTATDACGNSVQTTATICITTTSQIGLAKRAVQTTLNTNGTTDVIFEFNIENLGNTTLTNIQITDQLSAVANFGSACIPTVLTLTSDDFIVNNAFNGNGNSNLLIGSDDLEAGDKGAILLTIRIPAACTPPGAGLRNSATVQATGPGGTPGAVTDISDNGADPDPDSDGNPNEAGENDPTPITISSNPQIGLAKRMVNTELLPSGAALVTFEFNLENLGNVNLSNAQIIDNLAATFPSTCIPTVMSITSDDYIINPAYNGVSDLNLLLPNANTIPVGDKGAVLLTVTVNNCANNQTNFMNTANASGLAPNGTTVTDISDNGSEPDTDGDNIANEASENDPTPITFTPNAQVGLAKRVVQTTLNNDGSTTVTFEFNIENLGNVNVSGLSIIDNLAAAFPSTCVPTVLSLTSDDFIVNAAYNGMGNNNLLSAGNTITVGNKAAVLLTIRVSACGAAQTSFSNTSTLNGTAPNGSAVTDISDLGSDPDLDDDGNPNEVGENDPTLITFTSNPQVGLAKRLVQTTLNNDGSTTVTFEFNIENLGNVNVSSLSIIDNLAAAFPSTCVPTVLSLTSDDLIVNAGYNGVGNNNLLSSGNSILVGNKGAVLLTIRVAGCGAAQTGFANTATLNGTAPNGSAVTDISDNGSDPDPDGDGTPNEAGENNPTVLNFSSNPQIGLAKRNVKTELLPSGAALVTFEFNLENLGNVNLANAQIIDNLVAAFPSTCVPTVMSITSDDYIINPAYNGVSDLNLLLPNANVIPVGNKGAVLLTVMVSNCGNNQTGFTNTANTSGLAPNGTTVTDISDDGSEPDTDNDNNANEIDENDPTVIIFTPNAQVGLAKRVVQSTLNNDGSTTVTFEFNVENLGNVNVSSLSIIDNLATAFPSTCVPTVLSLTSDDYIVNAGYNGLGNNNLLSSGNAITVGDKGAVLLTIRVAGCGAAQTGFTNAATLTGLAPNGSAVTDLSDSGVDPDPDGDGIPNEVDENDPTVITFSSNPQVGLAKRMVSTTLLPSGAALVTFEFNLENLGNVNLANAQIIDDLAAAFPSTCVPSIVSITSNDYIINPAYNGVSNTNLLLPNTNVLPVGDKGSVLLTIQINNCGNNQTGFTNTATATGLAPNGTTVTDVSADGSDPDPDGDNNANEIGENDPTLITFTPNAQVGLAKRVVQSTLNNDGSTTVSFEFNVENLGNVNVSGLSIIDNLAAAFPSTCVPTVQSLTSNDYLVNPGYNGIGNNNLLGSGNIIMVGNKGTVLLTIRVAGCGAAQTGFLNTATLNGTAPNGSPVTDISDSGSDPDPDEDGIPNEVGENDPTVINFSSNPQVGLAKRTVETELLPTGAAIVTFEFNVENLGNVNLANAQITDNLAAAFPSTCVPTVMSITSNDYIINPAYNGVSDLNLLLPNANILLAGDKGQILLTVMVSNCGNDQTGFMNIANASGLAPSGATVTDISDSGSDPDPDGDGNANEVDENDPTLISFTLNAQLGLAKRVVQTILNVDGSSTVTFEFNVENLGNVNVSNLSIIDDLAAAFPSTCMPTVLSLTSANYIVNPAYNGIGNNNLLSAGNTIMVGDIGSVLLTIWVAGCGPGQTGFTNTAAVNGLAPNGSPVTDVSDSGSDPDPDGDGVANEVNENDPTVIILNSNSQIGLAKRTVKTELLPNGAAMVTFEFNLENMGNVNLTNAQIIDNLAAAFPSTCVPTVMGITSDDFIVNPAYNGLSDLNLLQPNANVIPPGDKGAVLLTVMVSNCGDDQTGFLNSATGSGLAPNGTTVTDISENGSNPDPNGNNNAGEVGENDPTPVTIAPNPLMGLAKRIVSVETQSNNILRVTFEFNIQNYGNVNISNLSLRDSMDVHFGAACAPTRVVSLTSDDFTVQPSFTGLAPNYEMLFLKDTLRVGDKGSVLVTVELPAGCFTSNSPIENSATLRGNAPNGSPITDVSESGPNPDPDGNGNPGNNGDPTPVILQAFDYGDLPDVGDNGRYPTTYEWNGARHIVSALGVPKTYLGTKVDTENDGTPSIEAIGDGDDEDGVTFLTPMIPGQPARIRLNATNQLGVPATIYAFADFDGNGVLDPLVFTTTPVVAPGGTINNDYTFIVPNTGLGNLANIYFRFRISTDPIANSPTGAAPNGEVEDYRVPLYKVGNLVWEDRNWNGLQDNAEKDLGINGVTVALVYAGIDGVINTNLSTLPASGGVPAGDDEIYYTTTATNEFGTKGIYYFGGLIAGKYDIVFFDPKDGTATRPNNITQSLDEDKDSDALPLATLAGSPIRTSSHTGVFMLSGDLVKNESGIGDQDLNKIPNNNDVPVLNPPNAIYPDNRVDQRFDAGIIFLDFGDLPNGDSLVGANYPTLLNANGPRHIVKPNFFLGTCVDAEINGAPDEQAGAKGYGEDDGDDEADNDPLSWKQGAACTDDEDGIKFLTPLVPGYEACIELTYALPDNFNGPDGYLNAWIDYNGNGTLDAGEKLAWTKLNGANAPIEANTGALELEKVYITQGGGKVIVCFKVPADAAYFTGNIFSRFRLSENPRLSPDGILAPEAGYPDGRIPCGEVEDYFMKLSKVGNLVWEDRNYNGRQDAGEPPITGVKIQLDYAGLDGVFGTNDLEYSYHDTTDANGRYYFCGLIGNSTYDPSGVNIAKYRLTATDPANMTPTVDLNAAAVCDATDGNGDDTSIDDGITRDTFVISNPMALCLNENGLNDQGTVGTFPDMQVDETHDFGYVGFDYGDLPVAGTNYLTLRDSMSAAFNNRFGPRHAIQPRLYLGPGVDGERNGQPDADAGSKNGGDDDGGSAFKKGTGADDETGIRLLSPMIPGELAYLQVTYTSQDTVLAGGYANKDAYLRSFVDFNGDGDLNDADDIVDYSLIATSMAGPFVATANNVQLPGGVNQTGVLAFRVPLTAVYRNGTAFMRHRLSWNGVTPLGPDNNAFHQNTAPFVQTNVLPYPQGEVEDYAVPVAKVGNLAWFDHDVFGDQDALEDVVDSLQLVLVYGGIDATTGAFDKVGYQTTMGSAGAVTDILYNLSIVPSGVATMPPASNDTPGQIVKTGISPAADSGLYSFKGLIPGTYYLIPKKYLQPDSASFVNAWPKHRVLTLKDNPGVDDQNDSDGMPGALFTLNDGNSREPEICVTAQPKNEAGKQDAADAATMNAMANPFPDSLYNQTIDFGWVDEPNIEANLDIVGVYFPTSQICGNFNVILHLCVKNPQEVPLDSLQAFLNLKDAYGNALYTATKPVVSIADSAYVKGPAYGKYKKSQLGAKAQLVPNPNYDGVTDTRLLLPLSENTNFILKGDSVVCLRIEFEIDPTKDEKYPWMSQGSVTARAVGFDKATGAKRPLTDYFVKSPRFGKSIIVRDLSDEIDDPMPMAGLSYPDAGDGIAFEGMVGDRDYTTNDKYLDEDDKTIQNDECWFKTRWNSGIQDVRVALNSKCESIINADIFVPNYDPTCGFDKYSEGSYYAVIIQDKWTYETVWTSDDPRPFDAKQFLGRSLIYKVKSVANFCQLIWGDFILEDKIAPVVKCAVDTDRKIVGSTSSGTFTFVCTDIDSILNVKRSWTDINYSYYTGVATAKDSCGQSWLDNVKDVLEVLADCDQSANAGYAYARITRTFTFTDDQGNQTTCNQIITFRRPKIVLPECKVEIPNNLASASAELLPADLIKTPFNLVESVPYFFNGAGKRIYLTGRDYCGFAVNYADESVFTTGECGRKIIRRWRILDWCYGSTGSNTGTYPVYHLIPGADADCYAGLVWDAGLHMLTWEQHLVVGDNGKPIVKVPDFDHDGKQGNGYQNGPAANPDTETATYDPGDVLVISTSPMDCKGSTIFGRKELEVIEQSKWCFDLEVVQRVAILDLFERPTGKFAWKTDPGIQVKGDCDKGYSITGIPMVGRWFFRLRVYDVCYGDTIVYYPVRAVDKIAPTMICDDKLVLTLNNGAFGQVSATQVDEGSNDNCGKVEWMRVRRPVPDACNASFVKVKRVVDANGNGKIDAYNPNSTQAQDYVDVNNNRQADPEEYFKTDTITKLLMTPLMDSIPFFCCDLGSVMVELWGADKAGNRNFCWKNIVIEDKTPPACIAPWEVTIRCDDKNLAFIDSKVASAKAFGDVIITSGNLCAAIDTVYSVVKKLKCGAGTIERIWALTRQTGKGPETVTCKQIIRVLPLREYNICFPKDANFDCKTPIVDTLIVDELGCDLLAVNVTDKRYDASDDECYKIFRTYTVINWCAYSDNCGDPMAEGSVFVVERSLWENYGKKPTYLLVRDRDRDLNEEFWLSLDLNINNADDIYVRGDSDFGGLTKASTASVSSAFMPYCENAFQDNPYGLPVGEYYHSFMYTQIIKVYDSEAPVVTGIRDTFCTSTTVCNATVTKVVTIKDNCTDQLELEQRQLMIAPNQTLDAGSMILYSATRWSIKALGNGQFEITVTGLPEGTHDLIVVGRDECGNLSTATRIPFVVKDCKAPAPICIKGLSTELMPDGNGGGMMSVWAKDFVASPIYDCNGQGPEAKDGLKVITKYSINRVGQVVKSDQTSLNLTCADAGKTILVELHAWDEVGNHDFCVTFIDAQDNRKVCTPVNPAAGEISGLITTDDLRPVLGVNIDLSGGAEMTQNTAANGAYVFNNLIKDKDYTVAAQLDKDHLNGVSTFDLVQIQKHILGVKALDNPYRMIAADVNNSKSISTIDMIQIRK
ncbi:MAG TPA: SdrD B-like domain-containing protein, partial [Haliscomenobacter sp.]|uniref:SdrD B-like domain-containing protein n=1 Tax=Haliscomenobacter sp. TaxID=2717303 RepID=UPI002BFEE1BD